MRFRVTLAAWGAGLVLAVAQNPPKETPPAENKPAAVAPTPAESLPDTAPSPPPLPTERRALINLLNEAQMEKILGALKGGYLNPTALTDRELERARLQGILDRLGAGADLYPQTLGENKQSGHPFLAEILDGRIAYVRPAGISPTELAQFDAVVQGLSAQKIEALILDLRSTGYGADFETAAEWARRVSPKGRLLFRLEKPGAKQERIFTSNQDPVFTGTLLVLVDEGTEGAAEVLAGVLRRSAGALLLGQPTGGRPVEFASVPIDGGVELRLAVAEAVFGENERAFPGGLRPDLVIAQTPGETARVFKMASEKGVSQFIVDAERPRLNEAALIARTNPEIEPSAQREEQVLDRVLQRAVDAATAIQFFEKKPTTAAP